MKPFLRENQISTRKAVTSLINEAQCGDELTSGAFIIVVTGNKDAPTMRILTKFAPMSAILLLEDVIANITKRIDNAKVNIRPKDNSLELQPVGDIRGMPPKGQA